MLVAFVILENKNSVTGTYCRVDTICSTPIKIEGSRDRRDSQEIAK